MRTQQVQASSLLASPGTRTVPLVCSLKLHRTDSAGVTRFGNFHYIGLPLFFTPDCPFFSKKAMAPHSSTLAWEIPWMEEPGRLQSMGSLRVRYDWATSLSFFTFMHWRRKWQPTPVFFPGESQGRRAWWSAAYGGARSRTRLKQLSSGSSNPRTSRLPNSFLYSNS